MGFLTSPLTDKNLPSGPGLSGSAGLGLRVVVGTVPVGASAWESPLCIAYGWGEG